MIEQSRSAEQLRLQKEYDRRRIRTSGVAKWITKCNRCTKFAASMERAKEKRCCYVAFEWARGARRRTCRDRLEVILESAKNCGGERGRSVRGQISKGPDSVASKRTACTTQDRFCAIHLFRNSGQYGWWQCHIFT